MFSDMEEAGAFRLLMLSDPPSGLRAILAIDDVTLGPAAGGIRTQPYANEAVALADAQRLAAAMTLKCAIAGLHAGGGKTVVMDHAGLDRPRAFRRLGEFIEDLGGLYRTAGDLGTTPDDLACVAEMTTYCDVTGERLGEMTGRTVLASMSACAEVAGRPSLAGLRVAIQGCGLIGAGVARMLAAQGARLVLADVTADRAEALATELDGEVMDPDAVLRADVDMISPCAVGGTITPHLVPQLRAWAICGGANNQLASPDVALALAERRIAYVPDFLASSGAVIDGVSRVLPGHGRADPLITRVGQTARRVLEEAAQTKTPSSEIGRRIAWARIRAARRRP